MTEKETPEYPDEVFILTAKDMCKNRLYANMDGNFLPNHQRTATSYENGQMTCCLLGHTLENFKNKEAAEEARKAILNEIKASCLRKESRLIKGTLDIPEYNDRPCRSYAMLAAIWNRAMRQLGYRVPLKYTKPENCK